jgi:hypothetical protein
VEHPVLSYAHPRRGFLNWLRAHRRAVLGISLVVLTLITLAIAIAPWIAPCAAQAAHLRQQYRISHQVLPVGTVIFTEDPARIAKLASLPDYRQKLDPSGHPYAAGLPVAWERVWSYSNFPAHDFSGLGNFQVDDTFGYLRTSPGGIAWIVHLDQVNPYAAGPNRKASFTQGSIAPVDWTPGARGFSVSFMSDQILLQPADLLTLFAPQPDPADASRINFTYEINGAPGMIDAVVTDRGYVQMSFRNGPAKLVKWNAL